MVNGEFVPKSEDRYAISPDQARMMVGDEQRAFAGEEAATLHRLLDMLSLYCAQSVMWWNEGQGAPVTGPSNRMEKPKTDGEKPVKVGQPEKKEYKAPTDQMVARAQ
jgi:hypothetical protein